MTARAVLLSIFLFAGLRQDASAAIVFQSYENERPLDADRILEPVLTLLHARGVYAHASDVLDAAGDALPLGANANPSLDPNALMQRIDLAIAKARRGKPTDLADSVRLLELTLQEMRDNPAVTMSIKDSSAWVSKALAGLASAHVQAGETALAEEAIEEQIRSYPELPLDRATYGPTLAELYVKVRARLDGTKRGAVHLVVSRPDAQIFVNGVARGQRGIVRGPLLPGTYGVLIRVAGSARRYTLRIAEGVETKLTIDWTADSAFVTAREWIGFVWPAGGRNTLRGFVARIARPSWADSFIVLGIEKQGTRRLVTGQRFRQGSGAYLGGAALDVSALGDAAQLEAFVTFLMSRETGGALLPLPGISVAPRVQTAPTRWPMWLGLGASVASVSAGTYLLYLDGTCRSTCEDRRDTRLPGWVAVAAGSTALIFAGAWFLRSERPAREARGLAVAPLAGGGVVAWSSRF